MVYNFLKIQNATFQRLKKNCPLGIYILMANTDNKPTKLDV